MRPDERHHRTRAQRSLVVESGLHRCAGGVSVARVVVCDRFGAEHRLAFTLEWEEASRALRVTRRWGS